MTHFNFSYPKVQVTSFLDFTYFILQYIPFWAIPLLLISIQFSYNYWLKDIRRPAYIFALTGCMCVVFLVYFFWAGSPTKSSGFLQRAVFEFEQIEKRDKAQR